MTKFMDKSFSTFAPGDDSYRDNWEATFGKKTRTADAQPWKPVAPSNDEARTVACPHCKADTGYPCVREDGKAMLLTAVHLGRCNAWWERRRERVSPGEREQLADLVNLAADTGKELDEVRERFGLETPNACPACKSPLGCLRCDRDWETPEDIEATPTPSASGRPSSVASPNASATLEDAVREFLQATHRPYDPDSWNEPARMALVNALQVFNAQPVATPTPSAAGTPIAPVASPNACPTQMCGRPEGHEGGHINYATGQCWGETPTPSAAGTPIAPVASPNASPTRDCECGRGTRLASYGKCLNCFRDAHVMCTACCNKYPQEGPCDHVYRPECIVCKGAGWIPKATPT